MILNRRRLLCWLAGSAAIVFLVTVITSSNNRPVRGKNYKRRERVRVGLDEILNGKDVAKVIRSDKKQTEYIDKRGVHVVVGKYDNNCTLCSVSMVMRSMMYSIMKAISRPCFQILI